MRATTPLRTVIRSGQPISARARLKSARIRERYFYYRHISLNDSSGLREDPSGEIKLILPYDGDKYLTRQAHEDVVRAREHGADLNDALVGFLAFSGYGNTDLREVLRLDENHGSYPVKMRLPEPPKPGEEDLALADNASGQIVINYRPRHQSQQADPVRLEIEISDPDNAEIPWPPPGAFDGLDSNIMRQVAFKPALSLLMTVQLNLPRGLARGARASVKDVFIGWPTRTSLSSLDLRVAGQRHQFSYNPERAAGGGLEWRDVPIEAEPEPENGDIWTFRSAPMSLSISKPGDLYHQESLKGRVDVTVDRLLSRTDARLFDATGKQRRRPACKLESVISTEFEVTLENAFARRLQSPYQQMYFDEVILTGARVDDVVTALRNRGFAVDPSLGLMSQDNGGIITTWLTADRPHGPDTLSMLIYLYGKRYRTRRQRKVEGGIAYQTVVDSGDLQLYVYGFLHGDSKIVVQEMNALRRALRERFDRLPARR